MTPIAPLSEPATTTDNPGRAVNYPVLVLLAIDGVLCAVSAALFLPAHIGAVPFPLSALVGGLVNAGLVWVALRCTTSLRLAALPLWTWLLTIALMTFGGPGDDLIFADRGVMAYGVLLLIVLGSAPPAWLLWRRRQALNAGRP
ncbi:hypothetical protein KV113_07410 [Mycolicibacter sp. MYC340]|uniref:Facilitated glucose transporter n=1 Tax=[Mycobacterium] nativiensis TaxID=2855503 RepID=A0ABU5XXH7_9MYCO|nr:hypothetical protein [Mycolicibacter sp. MYC340]MEB3031385.1 hypothetical protein [Mycolicibacter sp. MYC340]